LDGTDSSFSFPCNSSASLGPPSPMAGFFGEVSSEESPIHLLLARRENSVYIKVSLEREKQLH